MMLLTTRDLYLRRTYPGMTEAKYNRMLKRHKGGCWICSRPPKTRQLAVDHDHKTGVVRGLLCWRCNKGLEMYGDDPVRLRRAADYLKDASSTTIAPLR